MSTTQAEFRARLQTLVDKFKANADEYLASGYAEAIARYEFGKPKPHTIQRVARRAETRAMGISVTGRVPVPAKCGLW